MKYTGIFLSFVCFILLSFTQLHTHVFFIVQMNLQLLAACYLQNNQAYAAYNILKGMHWMVIIYHLVANIWFTISTINCHFLQLFTILLLIFILFLLSLLSEGTQMAQSRYLFAKSCFRMNLFSEAEAALSPANEPNAEVFWFFFFYISVYLSAM